MKVKVRVQKHIRKAPSMFLHPMLRRPNLRRHTVPHTLQQAIYDVVSGRRTGYTWTRDWRFDVNDPVDMEFVYEKLRGRTIYVIALTNRTLEEFGNMEPQAFPNVGLWRADDGTIYADDIDVWYKGGRAIKNDTDAINVARNRHQQSLLKVDGFSRSFSFIEVSPQDIYSPQANYTSMTERVEPRPFSVDPEYGFSGSQRRIGTVDTTPPYEPGQQRKVR